MHPYTASNSPKDLWQVAVEEKHKDEIKRLKEIIEAYDMSNATAANKEPDEKPTKTKSAFRATSEEAQEEESEQRPLKGYDFKCAPKPEKYDMDPSQYEEWR